MTITLDFKTFFQKQWKKLVYGAFLVCTLALSIGLAVWANAGGKENTVYVSATAETSPTTRLEYLVGETVDLTGVTMTLPDGKQLSKDEYTATADFSAAGLKAVQLSYTEGNTVYETAYAVEVFAVRHLDVRDKTIDRNRDGSWDVSDLVIWAELSGASHEFEKPEQFSDIDDTAIVLDERLFQVEVTETQFEGFYQATITCGRLSASFSFTPDTDALVQDFNRILAFTNTSGGGEKLTLYVQSNSNGFVPPNGSQNIEVRGTYVYDPANGEKPSKYEFIYTLNGWSSSFNSASVGQGLTDEQSGDDMQVTVNGVTFSAVGSAWRKAVLNM